MGDQEIVITRYDRLSDIELNQRLREEQHALEQQGQAEQARLLHELAVYQIELEMQNRELREAQAELETARDRYADLFDHAPVGYIMLDRRGYVLNVNATGAQLLRTTPLRMKGAPLGIHVAKQDIPCFFDHVHRAFESNKTVVDELTMKSLDGHTIEARLTSRVHREKNSADTLCRVAVADLNAQRRAEAESRAHREALAHATRLSTLGEMATGIAHELGQPLAAIKMYAAAMGQLLDGESIEKTELTEIVYKISQQADRAVETIQGIRRFARKEPPSLQFENVRAMIVMALNVMAPELRTAGVAVEVTGAELIPRVYVDHTLVEQVLINLLHNGVEAIAGGREGRISITMHSLSRDLVEVAVTDNGPGIPEDQRDKLFVPFQSCKPKGLGVGLSLSRSMIESLGGSLWLDSSSSAGTTFKLTLPTYVT